MITNRLTKKYLMGLPQDVFLASNCFNQETGLPLIYEKVIAHWARKRQWKKIKEVSANGRNCHVFKTKAQADDWLRGVFNLTPIFALRRYAKQLPYLREAHHHKYLSNLNML